MTKKKIVVLAASVGLAMAFTSCASNQAQPPQAGTPQQQASFQTMQGNTTIVMVCPEKALESDGELRGLGISSPQTTISLAQTEANGLARADIRERFIGYIKAAGERFIKSTDARSGKRMTEADLQNYSMDAVEKNLDKYLQRICLEVQQQPNGLYLINQVIGANTKQVVDAVVDNLASDAEVMQVEFDKQQFRNFVDDELKKQREFNQKNTH